MVALSQPVLSAIDQLRDVDRLIDFSKSTLQLDIMLALNNRGDLTPAEISSVIGQRRKAITDALRKMRNKGLVEPTTEEGRSPSYRLTDKGYECMITIHNFVGKRSSFSSAPTSVFRSTLVASKGYSFDLSQLPLASALSQVLFALGTSKSNSLPLPELARIMGLSEQRAESYLEVFMKSEPRLFRRFTDYPLWAKILRRMGVGIKPKRLVVYYGLTQEGLQHFYRLPAYNRMRRSKSYRILRSLTLTSSPKGIVRRLIVLLLVGEIFSLIGMVVPVDLRITSFWLAFTILVGSVSLSSLTLYRMIEKF